MEAIAVRYKRVVQFNMLVMAAALIGGVGTGLCWYYEGVTSTHCKVRASRDPHSHAC